MIAWFKAMQPRWVYIERLTGWAGPGSRSVGTTSYKLGYSTGELSGALAALKIPYKTVPPQTWQGKLKLTKKKVGKEKESSANHKRRIKQHMEKLLGTHLTNALGDAAAIAWWGCQFGKDY